MATVTNFYVHVTIQINYANKTQNLSCKSINCREGKLDGLNTSHYGLFIMDLESLNHLT